jgi:predicted AAA+ superfamily ATPase
MRRILYFDLIKQIDHKNALIITGMRQVGKTTLMKMLFNEVNTPKLWFDFDNPLDLLPFESVDYNQIYYKLVQLSNKSEDDRLFVFIDEIQNFPEITKIIKYLIDYYNVKFIVTGSSNYYMRNLFPESLSGRKFLYELNPLSFKEFLFFKEVVPESHIKELQQKIDFNKKTEYEYHKNRQYYDEYVEYGGFPEVVLTNDIETKKLVLKNIFASFFEKDIKVFTELKDVRELRDLILLLAPRSGNILDITKLSSELGVNRVKIYNYLEFLQGIFFIKLISKFSRSVDRSVAAGKKIYFSDTGILNIVSKVTDGQLFETAVCNQLQPFGELSYYNKRNESEIDFIVNQQIALEVKTKATPKDLDKLNKITKSLDISKGYIISRNFTSLEQIVFPQFI